MAQTCAAARAARKRLTIGGLSPDDGLLDVGRVIALAGYGEECKLLPFLGREYYEQDDFLLATKSVPYGPFRRRRLLSPATAASATSASFSRPVWTPGGQTPAAAPPRSTWPPRAEA
jgi:hypothetical protein